MSEETKKLTRTQEVLSKGMARGLDLAAGKDTASIKAFVDNQRRLHPGLDDSALSDRIIAKQQWFGGMAGFVWGLGGYWTLIPNMAHIWRIHGRLILSIAYIYGYDLNEPERREEIALCFALSATNEAVNKMLREAGMLGAKKALLKPAAKEFIKKLPNKLVTIAGKKSLANVTKIVPVAGGILGGTVDFLATRAVGKAAKAFYD